MPYHTTEGVYRAGVEDIREALIMGNGTDGVRMSASDYVEVSLPEDLRDRLRAAKSLRGETYAEFIERTAGDELDSVEIHA